MQLTKSDSIKEIAAAIVKVMAEVKGIEKSMTVGSGQNAYKGVPDQQVKKIIGESMAKNGLSIVPTGVTPLTKIDRWEENGQYGQKQRQSVFTEVTTTYLLLHTSGEFIELSGYGHGTDAQDKSAGKATTYALKYALLYTFLVPTGKIDDSDNDHSDDIDPPPATTVPKADDKPWLNEKDDVFAKAIDKLKKGETTIEKIAGAFKLSKAVREILQQAVKQ